MSVDQVVYGNVAKEEVYPNQINKKTAFVET